MAREKEDRPQRFEDWIVYYHSGFGDDGSESYGKVTIRTSLVKVVVTLGQVIDDVNNRALVMMAGSASGMVRVLHQAFDDRGRVVGVYGTGRHTKHQQ